MRSLLLAALLLAPLSACDPPAAQAGCGSRVDTGPLPEWARSGFTGDSSTPHVLGARGEIVAVMFGHPLTADRTDGKANKVLWVAKSQDGAGDLTITATLDGTTTTSTQAVKGGPGPSITDLPQAGCWHVALAWPGHTDTLDLTYAAPTPSPGALRSAS